MVRAEWASALLEWRECLGSEFVVTDRPALAAAATTTFATAQTIPAILRPGTRAEVQDCLRIATRYRVGVYPVSSGKNWGYGSSVPTRTETAILDLSRMTRILDFDEKLAYVTVEPGVTQAQLVAFLAERGAKLWMDSTGSSPLASLVGNTMERGFGHTPYGDHFAHSCGLEVVLPGGECVETGYARFPGAKCGALHRWGLGASLDGLFSQSNFGVVTRMTIWLMPAPAYFQAFFFRCDEGQDFGAAIEALSQLRLSGTLQSAVHVGNDYKVLGGLGQYPWEETGGATPLGLAQMAVMRKRLQIGVWNGSGGLYGTRRQVSEARRLVRAALKRKVSRLVFMDDRLLALSLRFAKPIQFLSGWDLSKTLHLLQPLYGLLKGLPTAQPLGSSYWRKRMAPPADMDPDRDGCGLLWFAPVVPATAADVEAVRAVIVEVLLESGFEPMISLTLLNGRAISCVTSISYDRAVAGEDERAMACYRRLVARVNAMGYYSYRLGVQSMSEIDRGDRYGELIGQIKDAVDPAGILSPGRYEAPLRRAAGGGG